MAAVLGALIVAGVAYLTVSRADQPSQATDRKLALAAVADESL